MTLQMINNVMMKTTDLIWVHDRCFFLTLQIQGIRHHFFNTHHFKRDVHLVEKVYLQIDTNDTVVVSAALLLYS